MGLGISFSSILLVIVGIYLLSSIKILLMSGGGRVRAVRVPLGIGGVGIFRAAMYSASELSVVAVAGICGARR